MLYPFGHGLSYTTFEIGKQKLSAQDLSPDDILQVCVPVRNTGKRNGSQVIQLYLSYPDHSVCDHPVKELKAFGKIHLEPGEAGEVVMQLDRQAFSFFAPSQNRWIVEDGGYVLRVGTSSGDIVYEIPVLMHGGDVPFVYTEMTPLVWFVQSEKYHRILVEDFSPEVDEKMRQETFEWCCLCLPLPFYKITEPLLGEPVMTRTQMKRVLKKMNE